MPLANTAPNTVANPGTGKYTYSAFSIPNNTLQNRQVNESVWQANFGLRFEF